jgi:hypothetical protein
VDFLKREKCHFMQRDVTSSGMAEMELLAISGAVDPPVVVWEGHVVRGYDENALRGLISRETS